MNRERTQWQKLRDGFDQALLQQSGSRAAHWRTDAATTREADSDEEASKLRQEVRQLIEHLGKARELVPDATESRTTFAPGQRISDRYRILQHLGSGGMSDVYEVEDEHLGEIVALKAMRLQTAREADSERGIRLLRSEVRNARRILHPGICRNFDIGYYLDQGQPRAYLTMERLHGQSLNRLMSADAIPFARAVSLAQQLCEGLAAAHAQSIVHGDLKPQNIFVTEGADARLVILDFGLSKQVRVPDGSKMKSVLLAGTPAYLAPERLAGGSPSFSSDLYSLGLMLQELLDTVEDAPAAKKARWRGVIRRCLDRDPAQRPGAVLEVLETLLEAQPRSRLPSSLTRLPWWTPVLGVLAVLPAVAAFHAERQWRHPRPAAPLHSVSGAASSQPGPQEYFALGSMYLNRQTRRSVEEALSAFKMGLAADPGNLAAQAEYARVLTREYEMTRDRSWLPGAEQALARSEAADPGNTQVLLTRGMLQRDAGHLDQAVATLSRVVEQEPGNSEAWKQLALTLDRSGNVLGAQNAFERGLHADPGSWSLYADLGLFYYVHGQFERAESQLLTARSLAPDSPAVLADLGGLYLAQGRFEDAQNTLERALDLEPSAAVLVNLGSVYMRRGEYRTAVRLYRKGCASSPEDYRMWTNLGSALASSGDQAGAREAYAHAVSVLQNSLAATPSDQHLLEQMALYAAIEGDAARSREAESRSMNAAAGDPTVYLNAATAEELLGARATALSRLERGFELGLRESAVDGVSDLAGLRGDPAYRNMARRWHGSGMLTK